MKYKFLIVMILFISLPGCNIFKRIKTPTTIPVVIGPSKVELDKGVEQQYKSTVVIDKEATKVKTTTKEPTTKESADKIIVENDKLKKIIPLIVSASEGKESSDNAIKELNELLISQQKETTKWKEKYQGKMSKFMIILKIIGVLCIPLGLFLMLKVAGEWIWVSVGGILLVLTGMVVEWIEANFIWILGGLVLAAVFTLWRLWSQQQKAIHAATKASEIMKKEIMAIDKPDKPGKGKKILNKVFGEEHTDGLLPNDKVTKKLINNERVVINKAWSPVIK